MKGAWRRLGGAVGHLSKVERKMLQAKITEAFLKDDVYVLMVDGCPVVGSPSALAVFVNGTWYGTLWERQRIQAFGGNVETAARHLINCHKK